ncbi:MAG: DNA polymerase III subunit delta' [Desulfuromonadaceae bacterium]|nr:DNA polymerase III subunit delta' [Desulfuromonadaceae bacterium]
MSFADILGHERIIDVLRRSLRSGKTSHSYIFEGISGCGRKKTALAFIQAQFCRVLPDDACGGCPSCRKVAGGNHADIHFIEPLPDKRDISIDQLRAMQRELSLRPYEAPRKCCIIEPAERMSVNAANSLLKTLEEPPGNALIILLTENAGMLLPTIRSRCQLIRFSNLPPEDLQTLLERTGITAETATLLAPMSGGSMQQALEQDNESLAARREVVLTLLEKLDINSIGTVFDSSEELSGNRDETVETLDMMISFFRDAVHISAGNSNIINRNVRPAIESISMRRSFPRNLELLNKIYETRRAVQRNANPKLALDNLFMNIAARER